jgi:hypothetical protein
MPTPKGVASEEFAIVLLGLVAVMIAIAGAGIHSTQHYKADPTIGGNGTPSDVKFWSAMGFRSKYDQ